MDQRKIGSFLKELRKEKGLTQEQLAGKLNIAGRTVSRWETGSNLPDVSMLVELADYYDVDIREIIDGERKGENMTEETRNVLGKVSEYVDEDKQKRAKWVRNTSIAGIVSLAIAMVVQTKILFRTSEPVPTAIGILMTFVAFITLLVVALYANGVTKESKIAKGIGIALIAAGAVLSVHLVTSFVLVAALLLLPSEPAERYSGIEGYDKNAFVSMYGDEIESGLYLFPDLVDKMTDVTFEGEMDTNLFDTTGYLVLSGKYSKEDFQKEKQRISEVSCDIKGVTQAVVYDESSFDLPAYVASDGYDSSYEYALVDEENCRITYVLLSCPEVGKEAYYSEYLKKDRTSYEDTGLDKFTIYAYSFDGGDSYTEFGD